LALAESLLRDRQMRLAIVFATLTAACTSTRTVPRSQLGVLATRDVGDGVVLQTTEIWRSRLDPASKLRLRDRAGRRSDWMRADQIYVTRGYIYTPGTVRLFDVATRIEIRGLEARERDALIAARPGLGTALELDEHGTATVQARGKILQTWIYNFLDAVEDMHAPNDDEVQICPPPPVRVTETQLPCQVRRGFLAREYHLRHDLDARPLGRWTIHLDRQPPIDVQNSAIYHRPYAGHETRYGWRLSDVADAEVKDLSGAKTLAAIIGTAALTLTVLPAAALLGGVEKAKSPLPPGGAVSTVRGDWTPTLADAAGLEAPALFGPSARRKAIVKLAATAEIAGDGFRGQHYLDGGIATLRISQMFDIGVGGLHLSVRGDRARWNGGLAYVRLGAHLPFDAAQRWSVPLSFDVGGGGGEDLGVFLRFRWGLSYRFWDHGSLGITPLTPTFLNWKHERPSVKTERWSVMSGAEIAFAF
jgi:hypothetical protein